MASLTFWTDAREPGMGTSTAKSPPTGRVMDVLATLADSPNGRTSAELAKTCGISTSTCALVLAELERGSWVTRRGDRRFCLGSGLFGLVHGLRMQFPLLDRGRDALTFLCHKLDEPPGAGLFPATSVKVLAPVLPDDRSGEGHCSPDVDELS